MLATPPINVTTLEGETAHFSCITKDRNNRVTWYKDGTPIPDIVELRQRSFVSEDGSLTIAPTAMGDPGEYMCEVTDGSMRQQASAHLDVQCEYADGAWMLCSRRCEWPLSLSLSPQTRPR